MEEKILDMSKTVYELCTADPEILPILAELGFTDITKPGMLVTAGRFMNIPQGAALKRKDLEEIKAAFVRQGYQIKEGIK